MTSQSNENENNNNNNNSAHTDSSTEISDNELSLEDESGSEYILSTSKK